MKNQERQKGFKQEFSRSEQGSSETELFFQQLAGIWYAFSMINGELYYCQVAKTGRI